MPYRLKTALAPYIPAIQKSLLLDPTRSSATSAQKYFGDSTNGAFKMPVSETRPSNTLKPLALHPTVEEVKAVLRKYAPKSVLEVEFGSGQLLTALADEFNVEGCSRTSDLAQMTRTELKAFKYDIATASGEFERNNTGRWDILLTRGGMMNFIDTPLQTAYTMNNMLLLARAKILIWERPEVCRWMQQFSDSPKFEYYPITE